MTLALQSSVLGRTPTTLQPTIERFLYGNQRTQLNRLAADVSDSDTSMTFAYDLDGVRPGGYVEVDSELVYVWTTAGQVAEVQRGMLGTTPVAHLDTTVARVEPRFLMVEMLEEIIKEIRSWPTNIYRRYVGDLGVAAQTRAIDANGLSGVVGASAMRIQLSPATASEETWARVEGARMERRQNTTDFPSGYAVIIPADLSHPRSLRVVARAPFSGVTLALGTDFGSVGLTDDLVDIIPWGVVGRLLMTRDVARTDANAQGRSRPAEEVRGGDAIQVGRAMLETRDQLLREAGNRLVAEDGMGWM